MFFQHLPFIVFWFCVLTLFYIYALFPMALVLLSRRSGKPPAPLPPDDSLPTVSLVIPAYNEAAVIEAKILNSLDLDYPKKQLEIIVACDGIEDATADIARRHESSRLRVLSFGQRRGKASVVNDAVANSAAELLLLCDANVLFATDALRKMIARLDSGVGAVSGDVRLDSKNSSFGAGESLYYKLERSIHRGESRIASMMGVDGGMYILRRELFRPIPPNTILDDFTVSMSVIRQRHKILYEPTATAFENATEAATAEFSRRVRLGAGAAQILLRGHFPKLTQPIELFLFVSHKLLRWLSPFFLLIASVALVILALRERAFLFPFVSALAIGILAAVGAVSVRLRRSAVISVPFYFVMSQLAMGYGFCKGLLFHQTAIWKPTERLVEGLK